ncbi:MAG: RNA polymerase sigma-70 factor [Draconibacterium sp.]
MSLFDQIFLKYYQPLLLYGLKFIDDENEVHDILQEVFVTVWENQKYKLKEAHLKSYLFNAVRNGCLNYLRHKLIVSKHIEKQKISLKLLELDFYKSGEKSLIEKQDLELINKAINSLSEKHKQIIELSRFEGLKNKEIARKLRIPERTVETRLYRALSALRKKLNITQVFVLMNMIFRTTERQKIRLSAI